MANTSQQAVPLAVQLENVTRRYEVGDSEVFALRDVNLEISAGEFVVILGASGSGKTTLLNMIGALDAPSSGRAIIRGHDVTASSTKELFAFRRENVGFVFQTFNLFPGLTVAENVEFAISIAGADGGRELAEHTLDRVGLGSRGAHFPHELSGGEQQRVAIARAVATGNPILLADEPTGELDFRTGIEILQLLHEQADGERCVIVVTHNREISRVADRVIELSSGEVIADGPPSGGKSADVASLHW